MSFYRYINPLILGCFLSAWIFGNYPIKQFAVITALCLIYFFLRVKHLSQYSDKRENETTQEYLHRKSEERYQNSILVTKHYVSNRIIPLIQRYGANNILYVLDNLGTKTLWTGACKDEVLEIMGKPYEIQYKQYTED